MRVQHTLDFSVGYTQNIDNKPDKMVAAIVPGAVQLDWARAHEWEDYHYGNRFKDYGWMEDVYWHYTCTFSKPNLLEGNHLYMVGKGIDYAFTCILNGEKILTQEGMFTPFAMDVTAYLEEYNELEILIYPVPKREGALEDRTQADQSCKPAVSYGWDWHPRLIPLGIWDELFLEVRPACHLRMVNVTYELSEGFTKAQVFAQATTSQPIGGSIQWKLYDQDKILVASKTKEGRENQLSLTIELTEPHLWWPNEQGEAYLYTSIIELYDQNGICVDEHQQKIGFRDIRLIMHEGGWGYPQEFPKSRSNPPITLQVNGRTIFCKGSNWVNPEIFPGKITKQTYMDLIVLGKEAHMNLFRVWGGGIINKEAFYEICDEQGMMIWQEFPLACNNYPDDARYLKVLDQESKSIITRLKKHPCLVLWCGGNELFNSWSGMTDQSLALRLLNANCYDLDPKTPFIMTSPLMGMAHGFYLFVYPNGKDVLSAMIKAENTAYTEFGCPGPSSVKYIKTFIPEEELFPPKEGTAWESHHGLGAWPGGGKDTWLCQNIIEQYFGPCTSLEQLIKGGQILQTVGYKAIYEEARRQKPRCSMALNWCFNEPWPTAANNSIINYPAIPKPSYEGVKESCRPILASARIPKFDWKEGEILSFECWILNDGYTKQEGNQVQIFLVFEDEKIHLLTWEYEGLEPNQNLEGPIIRKKLPSKPNQFMQIKLEVPGKEEYNSTYVLKYTSSSLGLKEQTKWLNF